MNYCKWEKNGDISKNPYDKIVFYHRLEKYDIRVKPEDNSQYHKELEQQKSYMSTGCCPMCRYMEDRHGGV